MWTIFPPAVEAFDGQGETITTMHLAARKSVEHLLHQKCIRLLGTCAEIEPQSFFPSLAGVVEKWFGSSHNRCGSDAMLLHATNHNHGAAYLQVVRVIDSI